MPATFLDPNYITANAVFSNGDLTITSTSSSTSILAGGMGTTFRSNGQWYFEATCDSGAYWNAGIFEVVTMAQNVSLRDNRIGNMANAFGYQSPGNIFADNSVVATGLTAAVASDVIGVAVDLDAYTVDFYLNNVLLGQAPINASDEGTYLPMVSTGNLSAATANFGATAFAFTPPLGFTAWDSADPVVKAFDPTNTQGQTLSNGNLTVTHDVTTAQSSTIGMLGRDTGKYQIEYTIDTIGSNIFMGLASEEVAVDSIGWNTDATSAYRSGSTASTIAGSTSFLTALSPGDVISFQVDLDTDFIEIFINGVSENSGTLTGRLRALYPIIGTISTQVGQATVNYGLTAPYVTPLPTAYSSWDGLQLGPTAWDATRTGTNVALTNSDLTATATGIGGSGSLLSYSTGQYYAEITIDSAASQIRLGVGPVSFDENSVMASATETYYRSDGQFAGPGTGGGTPPSYTTGDVIGILADFDAQTISWTKNGVAAGSGSRTLTTVQDYFIRVSMNATGSGVTANFGGAPFSFAAPIGYLAWNGSALGPTVLTMTPSVLKSNTLTNVAFVGQEFTGTTIVRFDDTINPVVDFTANNVTATTLDADVTLPLGTYNVSLFDGVDVYPQDEVMSVPVSVDGTIIGCDNTQMRYIRVYRWDTGAFLSQQLLDLNSGQDYFVDTSGYTGEVYIVSHKMGELAPFKPIITAGPVVGD